MINRECPIVMDKICRSCMTETTEMRSVFDSSEEHESGQSVQLATMLMACASVHVVSGDGLPNSLCVACEQQLGNAYRFKQRCEKTDTTLREYSNQTATAIKQESDSLDIVVKPDIHNEMLDAMYTERIDGATDFDSNDSNQCTKKRTKTPKAACKYCSKMFSNKRSLDLHQKRHKGQTLCCYVCREKFTKTKHLLCHMKTHNDTPDDFKHVCFSCGMGFSKAYHLLKHKKEHKLDGGGVGFKEESVCDLENGNAENNHEDVGTTDAVVVVGDGDGEISSDSEGEDVVAFDFAGGGEKNSGDAASFPCEFCGKVLTTNMGLQIHIRRHTGTNLSACAICDKTFTKNSHLKRHMVIHTTGIEKFLAKERPEIKEKKYLECEYCDRKFVYKKSFQHHIQTEHGVSDDSDAPLSNYTKKDPIKTEPSSVEPSINDLNKPENVDEDGEAEDQENFLDGQIVDEKKLIHACHVCEAKFARPNHLTRHMTLHRAILIHKCERCEKAFATTDHLAKHVQEYHIDRPYVCSTCEKPFSRGEHLIRHLKVHKDINLKEEQEHKCSICEKIFTRSDHLARHTKLHLQQDKRHVCGECGKAFNRLDNLRTHQRVHSGLRDQQRLHLCIYCGKEFNNSSNMIVHMRRHTGERPYKCAQCGKGFPRSHDLKCHERTHSGEKPYLCTLCGKSFNKSNKLLRHTRVHTGERPYVCNLCGRAFTQSNDLALHMRRHTGSRPYACGMCPARFIQSGQLKAHRRSQGHWVETPPDLKGGHRVSPVTPITNPVPIKFKSRVAKITRTEPRILGHTIGIMGNIESPTTIMVDSAKILESFQNAAALATFAASQSVINMGIPHETGIKLSADVHNFNQAVTFAAEDQQRLREAEDQQQQRLGEAETPIDIEGRASTSTFQNVVETESNIIFSTANITSASNTFTSSDNYNYQTYG